MKGIEIMNNIYDSVRLKYTRKNKVLFNYESPCLEKLIETFEKQTHLVIVMWSLDCVESSLSMCEYLYPNDLRPRKTIEICKLWAKGEIKMPEAKKAILEVHAIAKETNDMTLVSLVHSIGQAGSSVHVAKHGLGLVFYELSALVYYHGIESFEEIVTEKLNFYIDRLSYWEKNTDRSNAVYAKFLL